jgi:hypothetical protein
VHLIIWTFLKKTIWVTVSGHGDMDTNCAIVGGIVATYTGIFWSFSRGEKNLLYLRQ